MNTRISTLSHRILWLLILPMMTISGFSGAESGKASPAQRTAAKVSYDLYKSPTCGCCEGWMEHMASAHFNARVHHPADLNGIKNQLGIKPEHQSCHTGVVEKADGTGKYVFEGHIPARYVAQFLQNPPEGAIGLAVPGMPLGSPGMEMGGRFTAYDILLLKADGGTEVYASISSPDQQ